MAFAFKDSQFLLLVQSLEGVQPFLFMKNYQYQLTALIYIEQVLLANYYELVVLIHVINLAIMIYTKPLLKLRQFSLTFQTNSLFILNGVHSSDLYNLP